MKPEDYRNEVIQTGKISKSDPVLESTSKGTTVCEFLLTKGGGKLPTPDPKYGAYSTIFLNCVAFGDVVTDIADRVRKGDVVTIFARMKEDCWEDRTTGELRKKISYVVGKVEVHDAEQDGYRHERRGEPAPISKTIDEETGAPF